MEESMLRLILNASKRQRPSSMIIQRARDLSETVTKVNNAFLHAGILVQKMVVNIFSEVLNQDEQASDSLVIIYLHLHPHLHAPDGTLLSKTLSTKANRCLHRSLTSLALL
jgi:hypothetical protein